MDTCTRQDDKKRDAAEETGKESVGFCDVDSDLHCTALNQETSTEREQCSGKIGSQSDRHDTENVTDKLVDMALHCDEESDDDDGDYLSASDGDSSDGKIQEWGETLPEPEVSHNSTGGMCNTLDDNTREHSRTDSPAVNVQEGNDLDALDSKDSNSEDIDNESEEKEEKERERKRLEMEDALTEEERQARLADAVAMKTSGNTAFKQGEFMEAIELYTKGLELCPLKYIQQRSIMLSNRAACHMKQEAYDHALKDCNKAIDLQPTYIKAIARRADAHEKLEKLEDALKDHQKILELDRSQASSYQACLRLEKEIKDKNEKLKEEMLGKLKDLGNMVLRPFGLSTNNFQLQQDPNSGGYSVQFVQSPPDNGQ